MKKEDDNIVTAKQSRFAAKVFNFGTIASVLIPFPLFIFWFGASMFVYAMNRHHPNPRVGFYTQRAAYIYYTLAGLLLPVLMFLSEYWKIVWAVAALVVIPLVIMEIVKAHKEEWHEVEISKQGTI
ncbi:MAG: hypothetical protein V3U84_07445 [Thiotrichaceae bacterium]